MKAHLLYFLICLFPAVCATAQGQPWKNPLRMAWSPDGIQFGTPVIFQDSAGVPSVIRWKGDTLIAAFQWFRQPNPSPSWDRVAVKFSYDLGVSWTPPVPVIVAGLPAGFQRPFDPTLAVAGSDSLRIYFSSGLMSVTGPDSAINTYSAISADGIHYTFEPDARVDHPSNRVIDPAVIRFNNAWHYLAPIGAPQQGAYHYISPDGLHFSQVPDIPSDNLHNWTGNYMPESSTELRFYGSGPVIWFNSTSNGGVWNGYIPTNIQGGDPGVVKLSANSYLMIYVGQPYGTGVPAPPLPFNTIRVFPNPASDRLLIQAPAPLQDAAYRITDMLGHTVMSGHLAGSISSLHIGALPGGLYWISCDGGSRQSFQVTR